MADAEQRNAPDEANAKKLRTGFQTGRGFVQTARGFVRTAATVSSLGAQALVGSAELAAPAPIMTEVMEQGSGLAAVVNDAEGFSGNPQGAEIALQDATAALRIDKNLQRIADIEQPPKQDDSAIPGVHAPGPLGQDPAPVKETLEQSKDALVSAKSQSDQQQRADKAAADEARRQFRQSYRGRPPKSPNPLPRPNMDINKATAGATAKANRVRQWGSFKRQPTRKGPDRG